MKKAHVIIFLSFLFTIVLVNNLSADNADLLNANLEKRASYSTWSTGNDLEENDPPVIIAPVGEITARSAQFYNFIWQPRHTSATLINYELLIYEKIKGLSDNQIINVTPPIFRTTTIANSYLYTPADPILKMNQDYIVLVQISSLKGNVSFKNNGKSRIETFRIIPSCIPGDTCDDGQDCTYDDRIILDCECKGTPYYDPNNDGICDELLLPAPEIYGPNLSEVKVGGKDFTTRWKKKHEYDLNIDYRVDVLQTGVNVTNTTGYQDLSSKLNTEREAFLQKQKEQKDDFQNKQQEALIAFNNSLNTLNEECKSEFLQSQEAFEAEQLANNNAFDSSLNAIMENCPEDQAAGKATFESQLKKELEDFKNIQTKELERFNEKMADALTEYEKQAEDLKVNFEANQKEEREAFLIQLETEKNETCGTQESFEQSFENQKEELKEVRKACNEEADDYKKSVKTAATEALKKIKEEIEIIKLARELGETKHKDLINQLEADLKENLKNASNKEQKKQIKVAHNEAIALAKKNHLTVLNTLDEKIVVFKKEQKDIKEKRAADLADAEATIKKLKRACRAEYRKGLEALEANLTTEEEALGKCLASLEEDAVLFANQQENDLKQFNEQQNEKAQLFKQDLEKKKKEFQTRQTDALTQLNNFQEERRTAFAKDWLNCEQLITNQQGFYETQQTGMLHYVFDEIRDQIVDCLNEGASLKEDFKEQQRQEKLLFEKEQNSTLAKFDNEQSRQKDGLKSTMKTEGAKKVVFTTNTTKLSQAIPSSDFKLERGYEYIIQVTAKDLNGVARFENNGLSNEWPLGIKGGKTDNNTTSDDKDGAVDETDNSRTECEIPIAVCPTEQGGTTCDFTINFPFEPNPLCSYNYLLVQEPGVSETTLIYKDTPLGQQYFNWEYCVNTSTCNYTPLSTFANDIQNWLDGAGYLGTVTYTNGSGTQPDQISIAGTNVMFYFIYKFCSSNFYVEVFSNANCQNTTTYDLYPQGIEDCQNPSYTWSTGETTPYINVSDIYGEDYDVTVTCSNGCFYYVSQDKLPCDDGDECTTNDGLDENCDCVGTSEDSDGDGVCDPLDICPGHDDNADSDGDGIPDGCDDCANVGQPCDDGNVCTINDVLDANCRCAGTNEDADGDGVCDGLDVCPGHNDNDDIDGDGIPDGCDDCSNAGATCDDGDVCTINDVLDAECNCSGTFADSDGDGVCDASDVCPGHNDNDDIDGDGIPDGCDDCSNAGATCDDGDVCTINDVLDAECNCAGTFADSDGDGVCDASDVCPGHNDNDDIDGDGIPDGCDDCSNAGATCDDGNVCTINDVLDAECNCAGTFADSDGDGVCDASDACPGHNDNEDINGNGIPDGCENSNEECEVSISLCPTERIVALCDYTMNLDFDADPTCYMRYLRVYPPGASSFWIYKESPIGQQFFNWDYCTNTSACNYTPLSTFAADIQNWLDGSGYLGTVSYTDGGGTQPDQISISGTDVVFQYAYKMCSSAWNFIGITRSNCQNTTTYDLHPQGIDDCQNPEYQWSTGESTPFITVTDLDGADYNVTVTCSNGCFYYVSQEGATSCDDGDVCTINDMLDADCNCVGTYSDWDDDGVCDALDICHGGDDNLDADQDGVPDLCDDCPEEGSCDDGNPLTFYDVWIINPDLIPNHPPAPGVEYCICVGTPIDEIVCKVDSDGDGFCDDIDQCEGFNDFADSDDDGVPDGCDLCPGEDDTIDTDEDGIPDACDDTPEGCEGTMAICPLFIPNNSEVCDYYHYLVDTEPLCNFSQLEILLPGDTEPTIISKYTSAGADFNWGYCVNLAACDYHTPLQSLVNDLQHWMNQNNYLGTVVLESGVGPNNENRFAILETDLEFTSISIDCPDRKSKYVFEKERCQQGGGQYILSPLLTVVCEDATYLWSTGDTTSTITVDNFTLTEHMVTVTCGDGCTYNTTEDYACEVGLPCNDYDPCTINDAYNECCQCTGEYVGDSDGDTVCDVLDQCPGMNDYAMIDSDNDGIPDSCEPDCDVGWPCDDGDPCTNKDVYYLEEDGTCACAGVFVGDSDGDFVCDSLDLCPGFPDFVDTDGDGVPDGCGPICLDSIGAVLDYCGAIQSIATCLRNDDIDDVLQFLDMTEISDLFLEMVQDPNLLLEGNIEVYGTPTEGITITPADMESNNGLTFNVDLIRNPDTGEMADSDGDGVADLFDICHNATPGMEDWVDTDYDGLPDACDCNFSNPNTSFSVGMYLQFKFDRTCISYIPNPMGDPNADPSTEFCTVYGEINCACECVTDENYDSDGDTVCDEFDKCHGGNDLLDDDGDGIPNACDPDDVCVTPDDPLVLADLCPGDPAIPCVLYSYLQYNDVTGGCDCVYVPDGDDDDDGVCNMNDRCEGFDDDLNQDGDIFPDGCDLCPTEHGTLGTPCDDNNECTANDILDYNYNTELLSTILEEHPDVYQGIPDPLDVQGLVSYLKGEDFEPPQERVPNAIWANLENTFADENGIVYGLMIAGCECKGFEFDSDYDGVCDEMDKCPGFDDALDYDGDLIPDGCDPPYYDISCPDEKIFLLEGAYTGITLSWNNPDLTIAEIPNPISFTFMKKASIGGLFAFDDIPVTNIQHVNGKTLAFFELPPIDPDEVHTTASGNYEYLGEIAFSDGQFCYYSEAGHATAFGCEPLYYVLDGFLAIGNDYDLFTNTPNPVINELIDRNSIPDYISEIDLTFDGDIVVNQPGAITGDMFITIDVPNPDMENVLLLITDIPVSGQPAGLTPLENVTGTILFDNDMDSSNGTEFDCIFSGGETNADCVNQHNAEVYFGEPCIAPHPEVQGRYVFNTDLGRCECKGILIHDADNDGVHDDYDICPGGDDLDLNDEGFPVDCECEEPVVATQDFGDGVPVPMVVVQNGNDVKITLVENELHASYSASWTPVLPAPPNEVTQPVTTTTNILNINGFATGETYLISIIATCELGGYDSPPIQVEVTIPDDVFNCLETTPEAVPDCPPLANLFIGDVVKIAGFEVTITDVTNVGAGGTFSGFGTAPIPYLNFVLIEYKFEDITILDCPEGTIPEGYVVSSGTMEVPRDGNLQDIFDDFAGNFDPFGGNLLDDLGNALDVLKTKAEQATTVEDYYKDVYDLGTDIANVLGDVPFMDQENIDSLNAALDCMASLPPPQPEQAYNDAFYACQHQLCSAINLLTDHIETLYEADYQVVFYEDPSNPDNPQLYGFDAQEYIVHTNNYEQIDEIAGQPYSVPWKSVKSGDNSPVNAKRKEEDSAEESIAGVIFKDVAEVAVTATDVSGTDGHKQVTASHFGPDGSVREVFAIQSVAQDEHDHNGDAHIHIAGKVKVVSYVEEKIKLKIVTVDEVPIPGVGIVQAGLDKIYKQAVTEVDLGGSYITGFSPGLSGPLEDLPSGWLSAYNQPMADIINDFEDFMDDSPTQDIDDETYYIFVLPVNCSSPGKRGYMPKKRKYGFVYNSAITSNDATVIKTIAHELGHGAFHLEHTSETYKDNPEQQDQATGAHIPHDNLMDLGETGTILRKYQWDLIHDPESNFTLFDSDEENSQTVVNMTELYDFRNIDDNTYTFITPSGRPITLPSNTVSVTFNTGDEIIGLNGETCTDQLKIGTFGSLKHFRLNSANGTDTYTTRFTCSGEFRKYADKITDAPYIDEITPDYTTLNDRNALLGFPCVKEDGKVIFNLKKVAIGNSSNHITTTTHTGTLITDLAENVDYLGRGDFVSDYALYRDITVLDEKPVNAISYPAYSLEAKKFLEVVYDLSNCYSETSLYAFVHAHQISAYPGFFKDCGQDDDYIGDLESIQKDLIDGYGLLHGGNFPNNIDFCTEGELDFWQTQSESIYRTYKRAVENDWATFWTDFETAYPTRPLDPANTGVVEEATKLFNLFFKWHEKEKCQFSNLTAEQRLLALELLSTLDLSGGVFWKPWEKDQENLFNVILKSAKVEEYSDILNLFKGNGDYDIYHRVNNKMDDCLLPDHFDPHGYDEFAATLADMVVRLNGFGDSDQEQELKINATIPYVASWHYTYLVENNVDGGKTRLQVEEKKITLSDDTTADSFFYSTPTVGFPFENVKLTFDRDSKFTIPNTDQKFKAGQSIVVPYCYAEWLFRRYNQATFDLKTRVATNFATALIAIATSPNTLGGSIILYADATYAAADILVAAAVYEQDITGDTIFSAEVLKYWDLAGISIAIPDAVQIVKSFPNSSKVFFAKAKNLHQHYVLEFPTTYREKTAALVDWLQNVKAGIGGGGAAAEHAEGQILGLKILNSFVNTALDFNLEKIGTTRKGTFVDNFGATYDDVINVTITNGNSPRVELADVNDWVTNSTSYSPVSRMEGIHYKNNNGDDIFGDIEVMFDATLNRLVFRAITGPASAADFPNFYSLFSQKGWNFATEFALGFGNRISSLSTTKRNELIAVMNDWDLTDFTAYRDFIMAEDASIVAWIKADVGIKSYGWKVLNDGVSSMLSDIDPLVRQHAIAKMVDDLETHPGFDAFLAEPGRMAKWEKMNNKLLAGDDVKLAEWFEDMWISGGVSVDPPSGNAVVVKVDVDGTPDAIAKVGNNGVDISTYDNVGTGPFLGDDVVAISDNDIFAVIKSGGNGACRGGACFPAETKVHYPNGETKRIEDVEENDRVVAWDKTTKDTLHARVLNKTKRVWTKINRIIAGQDTITVTNSHPFYVPELNKYLEASRIKEGMRLLTMAGAMLVVDDVQAIDSTLDVHNFEVEQLHNYFVGTEGVLVHNATCADWWHLRAGIAELRPDWNQGQIDRFVEFLKRKENGVYQIVKNLQDSDNPDQYMDYWEFMDTHEITPINWTNLTKIQEDGIDFYNSFLANIPAGDNRAKAYWLMRSENYKPDNGIYQNPDFTIDDVINLADDLTAKQFLRIKMENNPSLVSGWLSVKEYSPLRRSIVTVENLTNMPENIREGLRLDLANNVDYPNLVTEIKNNYRYLSYYEKAFLEETKYWIYALLRKHYSNSPMNLTPDFKKLLENKEVPLLDDYTNSTANLANQYLGTKIEELRITPKMKYAFEPGGNFSLFPPAVKNKLLSYYNQSGGGYTTLLENPIITLTNASGVQVSPKPDYLLLRTIGPNKHEVIYFDAKLGTDIDLNDAQIDFNETIITGAQVVITSIGYKKGPATINLGDEIVLIKTYKLGPKVSTSAGQVSNVVLESKHTPPN